MFRCGGKATREFHLAPAGIYSADCGRVAKKKQRRYSDEERANALAALAANGGNVKRTAKQLKIPEKTLANWAKGVSHPEAAKTGDQKKGDMADAFDRIAWAVLEGLTPECLQVAIQKGDIAKLGTLAGICVDKALLLRGRATTITRTEDDDVDDKLTDDEVEGMHRTYAAARARKANPSANGQAETVVVLNTDDA